MMAKRNIPVLLDNEILVSQPIILLTKTFQLITKALIAIICRILAHAFFGKGSYIIMVVLSHVLARNAFYLIWLDLLYGHVKSVFMFLVLYDTVFMIVIVLLLATLRSLLKVKA
jgi:hypothetical protein